MVLPSRAYFGQKDGQQLRVIEKMVQDLNLPVSIIGCPTVREKDGLAMSSRNVYLSPNEREQAPHIYAALCASAKRFTEGEKNAAALIAKAKTVLSTASDFKLQYLDIRSWKTFETVETVQEKCILAVAGHFGKTRLIDNMILNP